jgi:glucose-1-phosphatase
MIRNIIFDLGNVLISFKPSEYLIRNNVPDKTREVILSDVFGSREWLLLDNGDITLEDAIKGIAKRSALKNEEIALIFDKRTEIFYPLGNNIKLLPELKKQGFKLYYLSNFPFDIFHEVKSGYPFFRYFEGGLISAEVRFSKPEPPIYKKLLNTFNLKASECLYIDDLEANVKSAETLGMMGITTFGSDDISDLLFKNIQYSERRIKE